MDPFLCPHRNPTATKQSLQLMLQVVTQFFCYSAVFKRLVNINARSQMEKTNTVFN